MLQASAILSAVMVQLPVVLVARVAAVRRRVLPATLIPLLVLLLMQRSDGGAWST